MAFTANQFHSWLFGFSERISESPSPAEWSRIKEMMLRVEPDELSPAPVVNVYCKDEPHPLPNLGAGDHPGSRPR